MKKFIVLLIFLLIPTQVSAGTFVDLNSNHWAYKSITEMANNGILNGYPDGTFGPDKNVSRAEFSKILVKALELEKESYLRYIDVPLEFWGYEDIKIASNYLTGYKINNKSYFKPNEYALREDVAVAVVKALDLQNNSYDYATLNKFSDKELISENTKKYIAIAVENNLMRGNADGTFNPKGKLTRAEASQLILNTLSVKEEILTKNIAELSDIKFNSRTSTIDLGENWRDYGIGIEYDKSTKKYTSKYKPIGQLITITEDMSDNYRCFTTDENGEKSYITIGRLDNLENYVKVECENVFEDIKYNSRTGYIDFGNDFEKYVYYISYTYGRIDEDIYFLDTEPINFLNEESLRRNLENKKLSVLEDDLEGFGGQNYVPFILIGLRDNYSAVKVIDTRVEAEKYLKSEMKNISKELKNNNEIIELDYTFSKNIEDIEVYVQIEGTEEYITENKGLTVQTAGKKFTVKFNVDKNKTYNVVLNSAFLEDVKEILKPVTQTITTKKVKNTSGIKENGKKPDFEIDVKKGTLIVEDFESFKEKYEYCYSDTSIGIADEYKDFKYEIDLVIMHGKNLYIRAKETEDTYASDPFYIKRYRGTVISISECMKSHDSNILYRDMYIKDSHYPQYSSIQTKICSVTGKEKYNSKVGVGTTIDNEKFDIEIGDTITVFDGDNNIYIGLEEENMMSTATLISDVVLEEKRTSELLIKMETKNEKVSSLEEISVLVDKKRIPENYYVYVDISDDSGFIVGVWKTLDEINDISTLADILQINESIIDGKKIKVEVAVKESYSQNAEVLERYAMEFYWTSEK